MTHPFEVGKTYRNRVGEYVVLAIDGDRMKIRYLSGGGTLETSVSIQARIWENIQFEEQMAREEERERLAQEARMALRKQTAREQRAKAKSRFSGFQEGDFESKKRGIAWSSREQLGKALATELNDRAQGGFDWWILPRQSEVHVARKEYYHPDTPETNAAFFVMTDEEGVAYGFRVGKPDGKARPQWPWTVLLMALSDDEEVQRALRSAIKTYDLSLDVYAMEQSYGLVGRISLKDKAFVWERDTAAQRTTRQMDWEDVVDYLQTVAPDKRCDLFICKRLSIQEALEMGTGILTEIADLFEALLPIYDVSVGA